jgi:acyl-CoA thioesterase
MIDYKKNYEENVEKYKKMGYEVPKPDMIKTEADMIKNLKNYFIFNV